MFLPGNKTTDAAKAKADAERNQAYSRIEDWAREEIPLSIRDGVNISVQEVICGDPTCAPIDTAIAIIFPRYGRPRLSCRRRCHLRRIVTIANTKMFSLSPITINPFTHLSVEEEG